VNSKLAFWLIVPDQVSGPDVAVGWACVCLCPGSNFELNDV